MSKRLILILTVFFSSYCFSQVTSDAKLWTGVSISKTANNFAFSFTEELRLNENFNYIDKSFSEIGVDYKATNYLVLGVNYRFSQVNKYELGGFHAGHRFNFDATLKHKLDKFKISFRLRIQNKISYSKHKDYNVNKTYSRNKFTLKYKVNKKLEPFFFYEFFYQFNTENIINRNRIAMGTKYKFNKNSAFKAFYMFEDKFNVTNLEHNHVWGLSYSVDF